MDPIRSITLSGLEAAARRMSASASNVANMRTTRFVAPDEEVPAEVYRPIRVRSTSMVPAGVQAAFERQEDATHLEADPGGPTGLAAAPDVDPSSELVQQRLAVLTYKANLAVLAAKDTLDQALLDVSA